VRIDARGINHVTFVDGARTDGRCQTVMSNIDCQSRPSLSNTLLWSCGTTGPCVLSCSCSCRGRALSRDYSHDLVSEFLEECALGGLRHEVGDHIAGRAPLNSELVLLDPVCYKEITDVDVFGALAARGFPILLQQHSAAVVLIDNILADFSSLGLDKVSSPADGWHAVIYTNELCFRGASSVDLVFGGGDDGEPSSYR
jgi:hypothetical protein